MIEFNWYRLVLSIFFVLLWRYSRRKKEESIINEKPIVDDFHNDINDNNHDIDNIKLKYEDFYVEYKKKLCIKGFHHDFDNKVLKSKIFDFKNKIVNDHGIWKANLFYENDFVKRTTFFPSEWSRETVMIKIFEAYENTKKSGIEFKLNSKGKYCIIGLTNEGVKIKMQILQDGTMTIAYPVFKE